MAGPLLLVLLNLEKLNADVISFSYTSACWKPTGSLREVLCRLIRHNLPSLLPLLLRFRLPISPSFGAPQNWTLPKMSLKGALRNWVMLNMTETNGSKNTFKIRFYCSITAID